jgi:hypothetical protein
VVVVRVAGGAVGILVMGVMGAGAVDDAGASAADLVDVIVDADIRARLLGSRLVSGDFVYKIDRKKAQCSSHNRSSF